MRRLFFFLIILFSKVSYSQKIEERNFDKFDSIYIISAEKETLAGKPFSSKYLYAQVRFSWLQQIKYINSPNKKLITVYIGFITDVPTIIDTETELKIQFADGTFGTYKRPDTKYQTVTELGIYAINVPVEDKLFMTDIKTIRIATSDTHIDYEIPTKKASVIRKALALIKSESEKHL